MKMNKTAITRLSQDSSGTILTPLAHEHVYIYTQSNQLKGKITDGSMGWPVNSEPLLSRSHVMLSSEKAEASKHLHKGNPQTLSRKRVDRLEDECKEQQRLRRVTNTGNQRGKHAHLRIKKKEKKKDSSDVK